MPTVFKPNKIKAQVYCFDLTIVYVHGESNASHRITSAFERSAASASSAVHNNVGKKLCESMVIHTPSDTSMSMTNVYRWKVRLKIQQYNTKVVNHSDKRQENAKSH